MNNFIEIKSLSKSFGDITVLKDVSFQISNHDFIGIIGPNGCGKTTLLNIISGINKPSSGEIIVNSEDKINYSFIFQDYNKSLMPWKTCLENIIFPLEINNENQRGEFKEKAFAILSSLKIDYLPLNSYPYQMSGGEKQITCIARALIVEPDVILFDEPFASLDLQTRINMNFLVRKLWEKTKMTFIFVSHDIDEAIYLSKKLYLLSHSLDKKSSLSKQYSINLPIIRPNPLDLESDKQFFNIRSEIFNDFSSLIFHKNEIK